MRIAIYHNLPSGGAKRAVFEWVHRLSTTHKIDVFSLSTADHTFCDIRPYVEQYKIYNFLPHRLFKSPLGRLNQFQRWYDLGDLQSLNHKIAVEINSGGYDVVFLHTCRYTFIPSIIHHIEIPSLYYLHEPFGPGFVRPIKRSYFPETRWRKLLDRIDPFIFLYQRRLVAIQKRSILKSSRLLSNSQFTSDCIKDSFGVDVAFCPIGVDVDSFQPLMNTPKEDFVLSVGEMSPRKGFDFIIKSLGRIHPGRRPSLKLACNMINEQELRFIEDLAKQNGIDLKVLTHVNTVDLKLLYNQARICVYSPIMEPFGLVPLEAMACGTPVVGVREGGVQESVVHEFTGLLVDRDPELFGAAIQKLMANPDLVDTYGRNAREYVAQNWTWERSVSTLEGHLEDCAFGHTGIKESTIKEITS